MFGSTVATMPQPHQGYSCHKLAASATLKILYNLYDPLYDLVCVAMPCAPALHAVIQQVEMEIATSFQEMGEIALTWQPGWKVECAHGVSKAQGVDKALQCKTLRKDVLSLYWNIAQTPRLGILWWIMAQPILHGKWKAFFRTASMN